jgi:DNA-binding XRE family transcriptional regulator
VAYCFYDPDALLDYLTIRIYKQGIRSLFRRKRHEFLHHFGGLCPPTTAGLGKFPDSIEAFGLLTVEPDAEFLLGALHASILPIFPAKDNFIHFFLDKHIRLSDNAAMQDRSEFPIRLKEYRLKRCWTLRQMGNATGISTVAIWNIENGRVKPHELTVAKIRRALPDFETESPLTQGA